MKGLWLAADGTWQETRDLLKQVGHEFYGVKGHILFAQAAAQTIALLKDLGVKKIWVDFKGHDIPNTVAGLAMSYGADFVTVHASGGLDMMKAAVDTGIGVYAVVFLTSLTRAEFDRYYQPNAVENMIEDAMEAGVTGFICPPTMVAWMRKHLTRFNRSVDIVVPGTRFADGDANDQEQVALPSVAARYGADYLVIGRMVTAAKDPVAAMARLKAEIQAATAA